MTTKLAYQIRTIINYDELEFNPNEPEPKDMFQYPTLQEVFHILDTHITSLHPSEDVFRSGDTFICYDPANLNARVAPDFYAAFGVDAPSIEDRRLYLPWEAGKPPDIALEVASNSTSRRDVNFKRQLYAEIGITEYWMFDRTGGELYGQPLAGERLESGFYQPIELTTGPDGVLKGYSQILRLSLCWQDGNLKFYSHETGQYLRTLRESEDALQQVGDALQRVGDELQRAKEGWYRERASRESADARIRELEEELRRRKDES